MSGGDASAAGATDTDLRDGNHCREIVARIYGDEITAGVPPKEAWTLWRVFIRVGKSRRGGRKLAYVESTVDELFELARSGEWRVPPRGRIDAYVHATLLLHYYHAKDKHPHFCDRLVEDVGNNQEVAKRTATIILQSWRDTLAKRVRDEISTPFDVLQTEIAEVYQAVVHGDKAAAVEECYDVLAVLLRMIDVLEGRQPIGKPKDGTEAAK